MGGQVELLLGHQRLVGILGKHPFLLWHDDLFLGFHADLAALTQQGMAQVDAVAQDALDRGVVPLIGSPLGTPLGKVVTALHAVLQRRHNACLVEPDSNTATGLTRGGQVENLFHHWGGVLVRHKLVGGALRLPVAVGRAGHILAIVALGVQRLLDLAGGVPQVDIVHGKLKRCHQIIFLGVKVAAGCQIADAVFRKIALSVMTGFRHITAQAGQILGDNHVGLAGSQVFQHSLEAGPLKVPAGKAVVHELLHQDDAMPFAVLPDNSTLVGNAGGFAILPFFIGKAVVGVC